MFTLLVDDVRNLGTDLVARTYEAGITLLCIPGLNFSHLYLDHDLGPGQESGHDLLKYVFEHGQVPRIVQLVTSNPVGRQNMANVLRDHGYMESSNKRFFVKHEDEE